MKNFRSLTKVTNLPKPVIPTYNPIIKDFSYANGNVMKVTFNPYHDGKRNFVRFDVFNPTGENKFTYTVNTWRNSELADVSKEGFDFLNNEMVAGYLKSIEENICSIDFEHLPHENDIENYGWENGWNENTEHPRLDKYLEDRKNNPYLVVYSTGYSCGRCCSTTINWTYGYKSSVDSSD